MTAAFREMLYCSHYPLCCPFLQLASRGYVWLNVTVSVFSPPFSVDRLWQTSLVEMSLASKAKEEGLSLASSSAVASLNSKITPQQRNIIIILSCTVGLLFVIGTSALIFHCLIERLCNFGITKESRTREAEKRKEQPRLRRRRQVLLALRGPQLALCCFILPLVYYCHHRKEEKRSKEADSEGGSSRDDYSDGKPVKSSVSLPRKYSQ